MISVLGRRRGWSRPTGSARPRTHTATAKVESTRDPTLLARRSPAERARIPKVNVGLAARRSLDAAAEDFAPRAIKCAPRERCVALGTHPVRVRLAQMAR
jgi:hypothetical protein